MNPRVLLRSSQHPSPATGAHPSQPARQIFRSSVSQSLVHRLLQSGSGGRGGTSPSVQFQNSFLFASAAGSKARGKINHSSAPKQRAGEKNDVEFRIKDKDGADGGSGKMVKMDEKKEEKSASIPVETPEKEQLPLYPQKTPSVDVKGTLTLESLHAPSSLLTVILGELLAAPLITLKLPVHNNEYVVLLVNPKNTLSALSRLIQAELPPLASDPSKAPRVIFKAPEHSRIGSIRRGSTRWGSSIEVGNFVKDAAREKEFIIEIEDAEDIVISVPSFLERSQTTRDQLRKTTKEIEIMGRLREQCDKALRNRVNMAIVGMVGWLVGVYSLMLNSGFLVCFPSFKFGYGILLTPGQWSVAPNVIFAALWATVALWLYFGTFGPTTSENRQRKLYESRGFNQEQWARLLDVGRALRKEVLDIAEQYGEKWDEKRDLIMS